MSKKIKNTRANLVYINGTATTASTTYGAHYVRLSIVSPPPVVIPNNFSIAAAVELMQLCVYTYEQYRAHLANSSQPWNIPIQNDGSTPYIMQKVLFSYEKTTSLGVFNKIPFGFIATKQNDNDDNNKDIYICFRGTEGVKEWEKVGTFKQVPCSFLKNQPTTDEIKVHEGFQAVYAGIGGDGLFLGAAAAGTAGTAISSIQTQVMSYLETIKTTTEYRNLWVTGHSLGGAVANFATIDIVTNTIHKRATTYLFASPSVGNQAFADLFKKNVGTNACDNNNNINTCSWRVINKYDLVPTLPPTNLLKYVHVNGCSGNNVCNNLTDDKSNNGIFQIEFADKCNDILDLVCVDKAHSNPVYLSTLIEIKNKQK